MHPTKFRFIWQSGFRGEDFLEINQSETRIVCGGHGSGRNEQSQQRTFHRYFLPSFGSFDQTVSEEKNLIFFNSFLFFTDLFLLIFKFEKRQRPRLMAVGVIIHGLKENYICIVPL